MLSFPVEVLIDIFISIDECMDKFLLPLHTEDLFETVTFSRLQSCNTPVASCLIMRFILLLL